MRRAAVCVAVLLLSAAGRAEVKFANIFNDHMVLQQQKPIRVWGWADAGARMAVRLTEDRALAEKFLAPVEEEQKSAAEHSVSIAYVERNAPAFTPQSKYVTADKSGAWTVTFDPVPASFTPKYVVATSGTQGAAISDVLIGEVWVASGQSNMEWPYYFEQQIEKPGAIYTGIRYTERFGNGHPSHWDATWYKPKKDLFRRAQWFTCDPKTVDHCCAVAYWFAKTLHFYLKVPVGIVNNARGGTVAYAWCSRERLDTIKNSKVQKILSNYDAKAAEWETEAGRAAALARARKEFDEKRIPRWEQDVERAKKEGRKPPGKPEFQPPRDARKGHSDPAGMYNGVVLPIRKLTVRGLLWYQGENNMFSRWTQHQYTFPHVLGSLREAFGDPELPIGVYDLAGCGDPDTPVERSCVLGGYAIIRDTMTRATETDPHAWLMPTYDAGHGNIHPLEKLPVGMRGARWALSRVYGKKNICYRGPKFKAMKIEDGKAFITFEPDPNMWDWQYNQENTYTPYTASGQEREQNIRGFAIAGADRRWYPAKARRDKKARHLEVWSDLVPEPVAVRYAWASNPDANLAHEWYDNLPVPAFRTDDWAIPGAFGSEYSREYEGKLRAVTHYLRLIAEAEEADRKIRQAFVDIEKTLSAKFGRTEEQKKLIAELKALQARVEAGLAKEVKAVQKLRLGDSPHGIEHHVPGYIKEYGLEEFRK